MSVMVLRNRATRLTAAAAAITAALVSQPDQARADSPHQRLGTTWLSAADARRARAHRMKASPKRHVKTLAAKTNHVAKASLRAETNIVRVDLVRPAIVWQPMGATAPSVLDAGS